MCIFSLLFGGEVLKYICKSVVRNRNKIFAHHFPPNHIGNRLEIAMISRRLSFFAFYKTWLLQKESRKSENYSAKKN